jgi:polysaccharide export outer membrane protein
MPINEARLVLSMVGKSTPCRALRGPLVLLACLALAGCGVIPRSGPSADSMIEAGRDEAPPFALVPIDDRVVTLLAQWHGPSLYGSFGDFRSPIEQRIGVGDSVVVTVWEAAAGGLFSTPVGDPRQPGSHSAIIPEQVVARDGSITVPYAGRVQVSGKTPPEIERVIVERLAGKAIEPQALVTLSKNVSNTVTVTGEVTAGARVPLSVRGDRLLDVVAAAGGIRAPAHETFIDLTRGSRTVRVPFQALLSNPKENIYARPGDVMTAVREPQTFTTVGATGRNAVVPFDQYRVTLEEAVAKSGGLLDSAADPEGVFVLRYEPTPLASNFHNPSPALRRAGLVPIAYHMNMRDPKSLFLQRRFVMRNKDIVFVSFSPITDMAKVLQIVNLVTQPLFSAAYAVTTAATVVK